LLGIGYLLGLLFSTTMVNVFPQITTRWNYYHNEQHNIFWIKDEVRILKKYVEQQQHQQEIIQTTATQQEIVTETNQNTTINNENYNNHHHHRLLCWIPVKDANSPLVHRIWKSWGTRCDELIFISTTENLPWNVVIAPHVDGAAGLWNKVHAGWAYIATHYLDKGFDWYIKLDDDSYFSPENFKYVVRHLSPKTQSIYIGHQLFHIRSPFNAGAAYGLSQFGMRILAPYLPYFNETTITTTMTNHTSNSTQTVATIIPSTHKKCKMTKTWAEDVEFRSCLIVANISTTFPSWDQHGRDYFEPLSPHELYIYARRAESRGWFFKNKPLFIRGGIYCCTSFPVNFHHIKEDSVISDTNPSLMYALDYLLYFVGIDPIEGMRLD
jgi:glycoprotein-N-acetylgalactosamine 3-beta-galactosyltransferase